MEKIIYYDKLFPIYNNEKEILDKLKIDNESVSYISSPIYAEKITKIILNHTKTNKIIITDCTAGCGGDTISFLNKFKKVYSFEKNLVRYFYLLNNIKAYNFTKNSKIFCTSFLNLLNKIDDHDVIYIDPPWGGKDYKKQKNLKLYINDTSLENIILNLINDKTTKKIPNYFVLKIPNNYDIKYLYEQLKTTGKIFMYNLKKMLIIVLEINKDYSTSSILLSSSSSFESSNSIDESFEIL